MAAAAGQGNFRNRWFRNETRAKLRGYVNMLPGFMQGMFPPTDIRRHERMRDQRIRLHPEDRDNIDPEWRVRAGKPAPTAEDIARRRDFILYEKRLAEIETSAWEYRPNVESDKDRYIKERVALAAKSYDQLIEDPAISRDLYPDAADRYRLGDAVSRRANLVLHGFANSLLQINGRLIMPDDAHHISIHLIPITPEQAAIMGIPPDPEPRNEPVAANEPVRQRGLVFNYNTLPDLGSIPVNDVDPISFEPIENGSRLLVITQDGFQYKFPWAEDEGISRWLSANPRNPQTGRDVDIGQLSRATASVQAGGRARARKHRQSKKRSARKNKHITRRR